MKKLTAIILAAILTLITFLPLTTQADTNKESINKYNVIFVIDTSISMESSDKNNNRFEATDLFLGMLANDGNYVGTVLFNGSIASTDIVEINGNQSKREISKTLRNSKLDYDTNIGGALLKATELLDKNANTDLPSIIILLSDGNTDFDDEKLIQKAKEDKETALENARDKGYTICAVSLNSDGSADIKELKNIANATEGGMFEEVNDSKDLKDVFDRFYTKIYGTKSTKLVDDNIGNNGSITKVFPVSDVGVEEVNVAIFGDVSECTLTKPDGSTISGKDMDELVFSANSFKIIKLVSPEQGDWTLSVKGKPNSKIAVVKTYNVNLNVKNIVDNEDESYKANNAITFHTKLYEGNEEVEINKYKDFTAKLTITDFDEQVIYEEENTSPSENGFDFSFTPNSIGTYYADVEVEGTEVYANAERLTFNVGNTAPVAVEETIKKHVNIWPFLIKTDSTIDLSAAAKDNEDTELTFKVVSSTWNEEDYELDGNSLTINSFKDISKGSFEIQAVDSQGAFCTFNVKVTSTNIGILAMILMGIAILIAIAAIAIFTKIMLGKPFMGEVTASNIQTYQSYTPQKSRGRIKMSAFQIGDTGLDKNSYFQATGKDYIFFVSKKPVSTDTMLNKSKKIKIENNFDTTIYADDEQSKGIQVRFNSYKNNSIF